MRTSRCIPFVFTKELLRCKRCFQTQSRLHDTACKPRVHCTVEKLEPQFVISLVTFGNADIISSFMEVVKNKKENGPKTVKDVKLISAGKILENNRTIGECRSPLCDIPGGVTTMHVVVQPPSSDKGSFGAGLDSGVGESLMRRGSWLMHVYHSLCFDPGLRLLRLDVAFHFTSTCISIKNTGVEDYLDSCTN
ncbi:Membrane-anchored ubiquitin-fold protein 2 [Vitis vinifera]|uniref:Membrane-anchored ubiquitin-fold protein 2 n=1 Tax=Vitis vinifera TaxID=29760 RepID=A0A438H8X2_VITVI|nr:Membrane-anchored ubiquitin-fold protein 2 [Vitis vinifera]